MSKNPPLPDMSPENYAEIYEYFENYEINQRVNRLGFAALTTLYRSAMYFVGDADEVIADHVQATGDKPPGSLEFVSTHSTMGDTGAATSLVLHEPFTHLQENTLIPAKKDIFDWPIVKDIVPDLQAIPQLRGFKDEETKLAANEELIGVCTRYIDANGNVFIFGEGGRGDNSVLRPLRTGFARIALGVKDPENLLTVPMAIVYRMPRLKLLPLIVIEEPFSPAGMTHEQIMETTHTRMQSALTQAHQLRTQRYQLAA
jgi:hypothetical protein